MLQRPGRPPTFGVKQAGTPIMSPSPAPVMPIDVVSDVVCPWCFIGKRRLEKALALNPDIPVEVRWHPYFLNNWVPREGIDRKTYLETKFGSVDRYAGMARRVQQAGGGESVGRGLGTVSRERQ